ncbi:hypothetical protein [Candidatus Venteria ishoeyi]|uniref:hypothetical protein n=1 Tax=Candidatus Venteria ishoeyi TaxID=1899563 RepID=UPI0025A67B5D|nr:hypothetical protein [Candidatus Venteria ishoeyi]
MKQIHLFDRNNNAAILLAGIITLIVAMLIQVVGILIPALTSVVYCQAMAACGTLK